MGQITWNMQGVSETTIFVYSAGKLVAEYSNTQVPVPNRTTRYLTEDHLGTPRVITDSEGNVISRRDFLPFGEEITPDIGARASVAAYQPTNDNVKQKFTGYQKDDETGLDFAEARMYENRHGRFTAVDPLLASGKSANPQTFNRYSYTSNNPIIRVDRSGEEWYYSFERGPGGGFYATPRWCSGFGCRGHRWLSEVRSTVGNVTTVWKGSYVFKNDITGGFTALDPNEGRLRVFATSEEAQDQVNRYRRQAIVNFAAGMLSGASLAFSLSGADGLVAETNTETFAAGQRAGTAASIVGAFTGVGLANALVSRFGNAGLSIFRGLRITEGALSGFQQAGKFGFGTYKELRDAVRTTFGTGHDLQVHHLIEKRFAGLFGQKEGEMLSMVLTKEEHAIFTKAWRDEIGLKGWNNPLRTNTVSRDQVLDAARKIYANHPEILKKLGL